MKRLTLPLVMLTACVNWDELIDGGMCSRCDVDGGWGGGGDVGGAGGGAAGGAGGGAAGGGSAGCSSSVQAPCRLACSSAAGVVRCALPGASAGARVAVGSGDSDLYADLAVALPMAAGGFNAGTYWMHGLGDGGFTLQSISSVAGGTKVLTLPAAGRAENAVAVLYAATGQYRVFSPYLADGGATPGSPQLVVSAAATDIARVRLTGWTTDGLLGTQPIDSNHTRFELRRDVALGDLGSTTAASTGTSHAWDRVAPWRDFVLAGFGDAHGGAAVTFGDGGAIDLEGSNNSTNANWRAAQEVDLDQDGDTELLLQTPSRFTVMTLAPGAHPTSTPTATPINTAAGGPTVPVDGGFVAGMLNGQPRLLTFPASGPSVREYAGCGPGSAEWVCAEVGGSPWADAGARITQGVISDLVGSSAPDLVLVDSTGAIHIYPGN